MADYSPSAGSGSITVAVKILFDQNSKDTVLKEFAIMASMMHPNIVRLYGIVIDSATAGPRIVMEYLSHGDLKTYLKVLCKQLIFYRKMLKTVLTKKIECCIILLLFTGFTKETSGYTG